MQKLLPTLYRTGLKITRRRGAITLGKINHRLFPHGQHFRLPTGNCFFLPPDPHFFGYMVGHESHITRKIDELVRLGDTCLDVGANIGYFTLQMAAKCGADGLTVAYEPDSQNFLLLLRNAELARSNRFNIECHETAVSNEMGSCLLVRGDESTLHTVEKIDSGSSHVSGYEVPTVSLDLEIARLNPRSGIRLIKIDVEGHEREVLSGLGSFIERGLVQHALIEISPGETASKIEEFFQHHREAVARITCWVDGKWIETPVGQLAYRTDIHVVFGNRS